ncbi:hypothetical protein [Coleofasciculus sp. E1-EBD-02]|uniref:hypothetical protein n=1 Tax=Coleofasciculus sp. E1-EBD-02 TaxID=3068481 RepID=UPI0032F6E440
MSTVWRRSAGTSLQIHGVLTVLAVAIPHSTSYGQCGLKNYSNAQAEAVSVESINEAISMKQVSGSVELV